MIQQNVVFRALADPNRRMIFERLTEGELAVRELTAEFEISQPAISQHLATLNQAALVRPRKEGRQTFYRADPEGLRPLVDWVAKYRAFWTERIDALQELLDELEDERED